MTDDRHSHINGQGKSLISIDQILIAGARMAGSVYVILSASGRLHRGVIIQVRAMAVGASSHLLAPCAVFTHMFDEVGYVAPMHG